MRRSLQHWTESSITPNSKERSVWRNKSPKRGPFPSRKTDRLPDPRVFPGHWSQRFCRELCRPIYYWSSKWRYSGIRLKMGRNFIINNENPIWWHLGRIVQIKNTRVWESQGPYWNCTIWRFIRRKLDLIITDWRQWWKEVSSRICESRILRSETDIMEGTPLSRVRGQNNVYKEFLEIVGNGKPTGSVWKETIAVSATIWISVEKLHNQIRLRSLSCSRVSEMRRRPEVPEVKVPVVECLDGLARITSEELAITHSVKSGTLQNACSTRPKSGCRFVEKCSHAHRQVEEQPSKRFKKNGGQKCSG